MGCTVLELLTGNPPYYELSQVPALFRIVQDEYPPLPDGISPVDFCYTTLYCAHRLKALKDFLMQCFQKDPNLRISAEHLIKHPWLRVSGRVTLQASVEAAN